MKKLLVFSVVIALLIAIPLAIVSDYSSEGAVHEGADPVPPTGVTAYVIIVHENTRMEEFTVELLLTGSTVKQTTTTMDSEKRYVFKNIVPGEYTVTISRYDFEPIESKMCVFSLDDKENNTVTFSGLEMKQNPTYLLGMDLPHSFMIVAGLAAALLLILSILYRIHIAKNPEKSKIFREKKKED